MNYQMAEQNDKKVTNAVQQYGGRLLRFIRSRVASQADAEDILQDVWYQFTKVINTEPIEQISSWLFRVARNRVTDNYRKKRPQLLDFGNSDEEEQILPADLLIAENELPEDENLREIFWEELFIALEELPPPQRDIFIWNELEDQTFQEISDRTGENIKTLISRKRYAVRHLRDRLQLLYEEFLNY